MRYMEGRIIVFEGIYSLGKSTQIRNLSAELARPLCHTSCVDISTGKDVWL